MRAFLLRNGTYLGKLCVAQILCSALAVFALFYENGIGMSFSIPTPTCPNGSDDLTLPQDQLSKCFEEKRDIYGLGIAVLLTRITFAGSVVCLVGGLLTGLASQIMAIKPISWKWIYIQLAAFGIALMLHIVGPPWGVRALFNLVIHGDPNL